MPIDNYSQYRSEYSRTTNLLCNFYRDCDSKKYLKELAQVPRTIPCSQDEELSAIRKMFDGSVCLTSRS